VQGSLSAHSCPLHGTDGSDNVAEALALISEDCDLEIVDVGDSELVPEGDTFAESVIVGVFEHEVVIVAVAEEDREIEGVEDCVTV